MSGIHQRAVTATAILTCNAIGCPVRWESPVYAPGQGETAAEALVPAFSRGWRIFVGARSQHTYCPDHGPKVPMRLVNGDVR